MLVQLERAVLGKVFAAPAVSTRRRLPMKASLYAHRWTLGLALLSTACGGAAAEHPTAKSPPPHAAPTEAQSNAGSDATGGSAEAGDDSDTDSPGSLRAALQG